MLTQCVKPGCICDAEPGKSYCATCAARNKIHGTVTTPPEPVQGIQTQTESMANKYPKYYKVIPPGVTELDIYAVCKMFNVTDAALSHALKKIMLPGTRTGGKSMYEDIKEARDTLNRWLELNKPDEYKVKVTEGIIGGSYQVTDRKILIPV